MANQPGIVLYRIEYASIRQKLTQAQKGDMLDALMDYADTGEEYQGDDPYVSMAFSFFSAAIRRSAEQYERRKEANRRNINKRWHKDEDDPDTNDTNGMNGIPNVPTETTKQNESKRTESKRTQKDKFIPPTVEEVKAYCQERGNTIDAEQFVDYYVARGWELKPGQKMRDWRASVRTWEKNQRGWDHELRGAGNGDRVEGQRDLYVL